MMGPDVAARIASALDDHGGDSVMPQEVWPVCSILVGDGLLIPQDENLGTATLGPFRVATSGNPEQVEVFIDTLIPAGITSVATGTPKDTLIALLSTLALTFTRLVRRSVFFGRSEDDVTRWRVLLAVKSMNDRGLHPNREQVLGELRSRYPQVSPGILEQALDWLTRKQRAALRGESLQLIAVDAQGGMSSTV